MDMSMGRCPWYVHGWLSQHKVWGTFHAGLDPRTCRPMDPTMDGTMGGTDGGGGEGEQPPRLTDNTDGQRMKLTGA